MTKNYIVGALLLTVIVNTSYAKPPKAMTGAENILASMQLDPERQAEVLAVLEQGKIQRQKLRQEMKAKKQLIKKQQKAALAEHLSAEEMAQLKASMHGKRQEWKQKLRDCEGKKAMP